jgi:DNA-binding response OmpR family regulator
MDNKILVVDDDKAIRDLLEIAFTKVGYTVHCAESAEEAQEVLKRENIQVMFLDLQLPGMNGEELCCQIRKDDPIAIIYAITGDSSRLELAFCRDAGFDDYFTKPVELEVLLKAAVDGFERLDRWKEKQAVSRDCGQDFCLSPANL